MDQLAAWRRGERVGHSRLAGLLEPRGELRFAAMYRAREQIRGVIGQLGLRQHVAPRADRAQRRVLAGVALRRQRHRLQRRVLAEDRRDLLVIWREEARAG